MAKYVIDIDEDNLDNNDIYCIVANAISLEKVLADLPVTPKRKKGKWIKIGDRGFGYSDTVICKCSECEYKTEFRGNFDGQYLIVDPKRAHKYCPSCGLEMEG